VLVGAAHHGFTAHEDAGFHLDFGAGEFDVGDGVGGFFDFIAQDLSELGQVGGGAAGVDSEKARISVGGVEGEDGIRKAALFTDFLEQT